ncbi:MAG: hypothetical protein U0U66_03455 [Cytophagaceae bacterium]
MKDSIIKKLTIIIEAVNYKNISEEVMKSIQAFEKSITSNKEIKLSFSENDSNQIGSKTERLSPESWGDYWTV